MLVLFALFAAASAFTPFNQIHDDLHETDWLQNPYTHRHNSFRTPFWNQRNRFLGLVTGIPSSVYGMGYGYDTSIHGTPFHHHQDLETVKAKLTQSFPVDRVDFEIVRQQISFVAEHHVDEIEQIIKQKITHGAPIQRFEAAILKECVKTKVARGLPIDKLESEVLKEVVKAKIMRGIPVDHLEAKICVNNIKNKIVKGRPCDPLDLEILIDFVKNKIVRNQPITNLESEVVIEALKQKLVMGQPIDPVEGEVLVECIKNKASRGSPISRNEEELLLTVVHQKPITGLPMDRHEAEIAHEIVKNKAERGEHFGLGLHSSFLPYRHFDTLPLHQNLFGQGALYGNTGLWNRCPTTGFHDLFTGAGRFNTYPTINRLWNRRFTNFETHPLTAWNN